MFATEFSLVLPLGAQSSSYEKGCEVDGPRNATAHPNLEALANPCRQA